MSDVRISPAQKKDEKNREDSCAITPQVAAGWARWLWDYLSEAWREEHVVINDRPVFVEKRMQPDRSLINYLSNVLIILRMLKINSLFLT